MKIINKLHGFIYGSKVSLKNGFNKDLKIQDNGTTICRFNNKGAIQGSGILILNSNALSRIEKSKLVIESGGRLYIDGEVHFYTNSYIHCGKNAIVSVGNGTYFNDGLKLSANKLITIGENCAISNNVTIMDSDFHTIVGNKYEETGVRIGKHVWIGADTTILKNISIGDNCVIGARSLITKAIPNNCMAVGSPARIIKHDINWE